MGTLGLLAPVREKAPSELKEEERSVVLEQWIPGLSYLTLTWVGVARFQGEIAVVVWGPQSGPPTLTTISAPQMGPGSIRELLRLKGPCTPIVGTPQPCLRGGIGKEDSLTKSTPCTEYLQHGGRGRRIQSHSPTLNCP